MPIDLTSLAPTVGELIFLLDQEGVLWSLWRGPDKVVSAVVAEVHCTGTDPYQTLAAAYMAVKEKAA